MIDFKLDLENGGAIFISDAHLRNPKEKGYGLLCGFLETLGDDVGTLVIAGDLFDFYIGDLGIQERRFARLFGVLERLAARGLKIVFCEGNHDFALGPRIIARLSLQVAEKEAELRLGPVAIYVAHGDLINPRDIGYRLLRALLRSPPVRLLVKYLPERLVAAIAALMSRSSRRYTSVRGDNAPAGAYLAFAEKKVASGYDLVVLGHTHAPLKLAVHAGGRHGVLVNLGDWIDKFTFLRIEADGSAQFGPYDAEVSAERGAAGSSPEDTVEFKLM